MKNATQITPGTRFAEYAPYGKGNITGYCTVTRTTEKSVFVVNENLKGETFGEHREGINTAQRYLNSGYWKAVDNSTANNKVFYKGGYRDSINFGNI